MRYTGKKEVDSYFRRLNASTKNELENVLRKWGLQQRSFYKRLNQWFENFQTENDKQLALKILFNFDFMTHSMVEERIKELYLPIEKHLLKTNKTKADIVIALPNRKGDSATRNSYDLIKQWSLTSDQIFEIKDLRRQYLEERVVVFFNDTHGSGNQFINEIYPGIKDINCKKFVICLRIAREALNNFKTHIQDVTIIPNTPTKSARDIFTNLELIRLSELGKMVYPKHPLGYDGVALLTAYYYQCPNNTLPIVWANGKNNEINGASYPWNPLFEYKPKKKSDEMIKHQIRKLEEIVAEKNISIAQNASPSIEYVLPIKTNHTVDLSVLPENLSLAIAKGKKYEVEKELDLYYDKIRNEYKVDGNPIIAYNKVAPLIYSVESLLPDTPIQLGRYHWFLAYLLINSDYSKELLDQARIHSERSIEILENQDLFIPEIHKQLIKSYWLRALTFKMKGHLDFAHKLLTTTIEELEKDKLGDYFDTIYLHRQRILIENQKNSYDSLLKGMDEYRDDAVESYYSSKRIFEFSLKSMNQKEYDHLFKLSWHYYRIAAPKLEQVYKFSYWKYLFMYFKHTHKDEIAEKIYNSLLNGSIKKQLYGQHRTLIALKEMFND